MSAKHSMLQRLRLGLAPRLIGLVVMAALVTGGLVGVLLIQNSRTVVREAILEKNLAAAGLVAKFAENYIEGAETALRQLAVNSSFLHAVLENDLGEAEKHLAQFLQITARFDGASVYDAKGIGWASGLMGKWQNRGGSAADREWFQQALTLKKPYLGIPTLSRGSGHPVVSYAIPIFDDENRIHAVLVGGISLVALSEALNGLQTSTFARASLMDSRQRGVIIAHSHPQRILTPITGQNAAAMHALSGERGSMETRSSSGGSDLAVFTPVSGLPWSVLVLEPVESVFAPINTLTVKAGFCLGAVMLIAAALGSLLVRKITRPVRELVEGTDEISKGNLEHHIPVRSRDEIGQLADAFNAMTISLKHSQEERKRMEETLRGERDTLERRVVERTQTLQDSERRLALLGRLRQDLIGTDDRPAKLKRITDGVVEIFGADFARIWMTDQADLCDKGCCHATATEGPNVCRDRTFCLHLMASSGRYAHLDGDHRRVPLGCYKIGRVASGEEPQFITNEVASDPRVHNHEWARSLGLVSFAGFRLLSAQGRPIGVLALFSQRPIQPQDTMHLRDLASTTSQVILEGTAREAMEKSEEKYRNLFANAQVGMYRTTLDGSAVLDVNQKLADNFGYSIEEILAKPVTIRWADPDARNEMVRQLLEKGVLTDYEIRMPNRDGEVRTYLASVKLYRQEGYLEGTAVDITERRRAEEELRESETRYRLLAENATDVIWTVDMDMRLTYVSPSVTKLTGFTPEEARARTMQQAYTPATFEKATRIFAEEMAIESSGRGDHNRSRLLELELVRKDGNTVPVEGNFSFLRDPAGKPISLLAIVRNITERKAAAQALSTAKQRLERASAAGNVALWEWDIESGALEWSGVIDAMLGFGVGEFPRTIEACNAILHPEDKAHFLETVKRHLRDNDPYEMDHRVRRVDGTYIWWHVSGSSQRNAEGRAIRMTGACADITARKTAEEERLALERRLQQAQKAESLGRMAGAIAHHFNNKIGAVIGNLELALVDLPPESITRKYLAGAMSASNQSAEISRLMLTYLGQTVGKREPLDLTETVRDGLVLLTALLPGEIRLRPDLPDQGLSILADGGQIMLILTNLVTNAMEAIGDREGEIVLAVGEKPASELRALRYWRADWEPRAESYACLSISDTGCGMDAAIHDHIFDPFFTTKFTGRGLGLSVVHGIVKAHQGAIAIESQAGQGATFHVVFPLLPQEALLFPEKESIAPVLPEAGGLVLVVDDEPMLRNMAQTLLNCLGYEAITARDGAEAVEIVRARKEEFRIVILDLTMPGMNGWETLAALRTFRRDLPVILSSGYDEAQVMQGDHSEHPQAFLHKPYRLADLKAVIETAQKASPVGNKRSRIR